MVDDRGRELAAEYSVEREGIHLALILESRSGGSGSRPQRNPDYNRALTLLLTRLSMLDAILVDAAVDTRYTQQLGVPEAERRLIQAPVRLAGQPDMDSFRRGMGTAQARIAQAPDATKSGNSTKRIRLRLDVPGFEPGDAARLARILAAPITEARSVHPRGESMPREGAHALPAEARETAADLLRRLLGFPLTTISGRPNLILAVSPPNVLVRTERSPQGQPVPIADLEHALSLLRRDGAVTIHPDVIGHRSSFLGAVLRTLPGTTVSGSPPRLASTDAAQTPSGRGEEVSFEGDLSRGRTMEERREQATLRHRLLGDADNAPCALCGEFYPVRFLWAAHIKKRSLCTDSERRDLSHIAMPACVFGCDALFEMGFISVGEDGTIISAGDVDGPVGRRVRDLRGKRCLAHSDRSEPYFRWHRENVFRGNVC